jgi:hypothetical protein
MGTPRRRRHRQSFRPGQPERRDALVDVGGKVVMRALRLEGVLPHAAFT